MSSVASFNCILTSRSHFDRCRGRKRLVGNVPRSRRTLVGIVHRIPDFPNVVACRKLSPINLISYPDEQDLYTDEETSLSTAYPPELRDQVNEKLNIKRRIRYRRNRKQGITEDLESNSTHSDGSPSGEGSGSRVVPKEEEEEEVPQMSITATVVSPSGSSYKHIAVRGGENRC